MGHLGRLLRPLGAVLGDLEASWWRLGPLEARFTPQGGGGRARARTGHPGAADGRPPKLKNRKHQSKRASARVIGDSKVQGQW